MPIYVSDRLKNQVLEAMRTIGKPASTGDIAALVGRSPNSVRIALREVAAQQDGSYPLLWSLPQTNGMTVSRRVFSKHTDVEYVVSAKKQSDIVSVWNKQREAVGNALAALEIERGIDVKKISEQVGTLAGSLASLAYDLQQVSDRPDWYDVLTDKE